MPTVPTLVLNNEIEMPQLGFGLWQVPVVDTAKAISTAFELGYRSIDTAAAYGNETEVGSAIAASGLPRNELFITTKLGNADHGRERALRAFDSSLARLGLDYVDLYLIHWPRPRRDEYVDTWRALEKLYADGRVRAIGVSNFQPEQLRRLLHETAIVPAVNQVELHPNLQQVALREFHARHGIATGAWSPLQPDRTISALASKYGLSPAQIVVRWQLQLGNAVIPKSGTRSRVAQNIDVFDFELADDDMAGIAELDTGTRVGPDPDTFDLG